MIAEEKAKGFLDAILRAENRVKLLAWAEMSCFMQIERKREWVQPV